MSKVSAGEHLLIGGLAGATEVSIMQPLVGVKNALQEGRPIPRNPVHLYRGLFLNAMSMTPITATQFGANKACEQMFQQLTGKETSGWTRMFSAAIAGALSGIVGGPTEMIVIHQQKHGRSLLRETQHFLRTHGFTSLMFRGTGMCMTREAIYASGYLGIFPVLRAHLESSPSMKNYPQGTAMLVAGITAGLFGSVFSHPFDTVKTRQQAFMYSRGEYLTWFSTLKSLYGEGGLRKLWSGYLPRGLRIIAACFLLNELRTNGVEYLEKSRNEKEPLVGEIELESNSIAE